MTNRLIKHEVIDIADRLEFMLTEVKKQNKRINLVGDHVKNFYGIIEPSNYDDDEDEGEGEEESE